MPAFSAISAISTIASISADTDPYFSFPVLCFSLANCLFLLLLAIGGQLYTLNS